MKTKTLAIIDTHKLFSGLLIRELECCYGYMTIHCSDSGSEFLNTLSSIDPDLVIVSLSLTDMSAYDLICRLKKRGSASPIIVINHGGDDNQVNRILELGPLSVINYHDDIETVFGCLQDALLKTKNNRIALSDREKLVLQYMHNGYTSKQIAEALVISSNTVTTYRKRLRTKTHSKNTAELMSNTNRYTRATWSIK